MVYELEVPFAHTRLQIDRDKTLGEQVVTGPVGAVLVNRRSFNRKISHTKFGIGCDLRPDPRVACPLPRSIFPSVVAKLPRSWNCIEAPDLLSGLGVECSDQPLSVRAVTIAQTFGHRRTDENGVTDNCCCRMEADFSLLEINLFVLADEHAFFQIDDAVFSE